jgi:hypothetical protein
MLVTAAIVFCPPTRGSQTYRAASTENVAFSAESVDSAVSCFYVRPPRPATHVAPVFWAARPQILIEQSRNTAVDWVVVDQSRQIIPPLRC